MRNQELISTGLRAQGVDKRPGSAKGLVFSIQGHSVHDGPGTRTTVFLAGCPLRCTWCCNPEGLFPRPVMMHSKSKCVGCGACIVACPLNAVWVNHQGEMCYDRSKCDSCTSYECIDACFHEGNSLSGKYYTTEELVNVFKRDRQFWGSRGGVTFSGGEPLLQEKFILPTLKACKEVYIHTCIETTCHIPSQFFKEVTRYVDWVFTDIKHMDPVKHKELTGVDNTLILQNIAYLAQPEFPGVVVVRIPIIPGGNDSEENIRATAQHVHALGLEVINILPFHRLGESKYTQVGQKYAFADQTAPSHRHLEKLKGIIEDQGLICFTGYETPF